LAPGVPVAEIASGQRECCVAANVSDASAHVPESARTAIAWAGGTDAPPAWRGSECAKVNQWPRRFGHIPKKEEKKVVLKSQ